MFKKIFMIINNKFYRQTVIETKNFCDGGISGVVNIKKILHTSNCEIKFSVWVFDQSNDQSISVNDHWINTSNSTLVSYIYEIL